MELAITKMSQNGQVVIPAEVRKDAGITPSTKFLVFNQGGNIMLKRINKEALARDLQLLENIRNAETQISKGKATRANTAMTAEEIDDLLMG